MGYLPLQLDMGRGLFVAQMTYLPTRPVQLILVLATFLLIKAEINSSNQQICLSTSFFFRTDFLSTWKKKQIKFKYDGFQGKLTELDGNLKELEEGADGVIEGLNNVSVALVPTLPDFEFKGGWSEMTRDDRIFTVTNVRPTELAAKCRSEGNNRGTLIPLNGHDLKNSLTHYIEMAKEQQVPVLVFDALYTPEGAVTRAEHRLIATYGAGTSYTEAIASTPYHPLIYDITSKTYHMSKNDEIPKTFCRERVPFYKLSKQHFEVTKSVYTKYFSVITRIRNYLSQLSAMFNSAKLNSEIVPAASLTAIPESTYSMDRLFTLSLSLVDPAVHVTNDHDPIDLIQDFVSAGEELLELNPILSFEGREFILSLAQSKIPMLTGVNASTIPAPFVRVSLLKRYPQDVFSAEIAFTSSHHTSIYQATPLLQKGKQIALDFLVLSGEDDQKYMSTDAPLTHCLEVQGRRVCDLIVPASADYSCPSYLFGNTQGNLEDNCPMVPAKLPLYSVSNVRCTRGDQPKTVIVARDPTTVSLNCRDSNERLSLRLKANSHVEVPAQYSSNCDIRDSNGDLIRRVDGPQRSAVLVHPFVAQSSEITNSDDSVDKEEEKESRDTENSGEWKQVDILIIVVSILGVVIIKIVVVVICYGCKGCRNWCINACLCCRDNCRVCADQTQDRENADQSEMEPLSRDRSRRGSSTGTDLAIELSQLFNKNLPAIEAMRSRNPSLAAGAVGGAVALPSAPPINEDLAAFVDLLERGHQLAVKQGLTGAKN